MILSTVKNYRIFFSLVIDAIFIFSLYQTEGVSTILGLFLSEKIWKAVLLSDITLRTYAPQTKQLTSHHRRLKFGP